METEKSEKTETEKTETEKAKKGMPPELVKLLEEEHQCEFRGCTFKNNAMGRHGPEKKPAMYQVTLFGVKEVEEGGKKTAKRVMIEALDGKGVRPVVVHYAHVYKMEEIVENARDKGIALAYEVAPLYDAVCYRFDSEARNKTFSEVEKYWKALDEDRNKKPSDRKVVEPAPMFEKNEKGEDVEVCGVPVDGFHTGKLISNYITRTGDVARICSICAAAFRKAQTDKVRLCHNRKTAEEIAADRKEKAEQREADKKAAKEEEERLTSKYGEMMVRGWKVRKPAGKSDSPKRPERDPKISGGEQSQRRKDGYKDEADKSETEESAPEPAKPAEEVDAVEKKAPATTSKMGDIITKHPEKGLEAMMKAATKARLKELNRRKGKTPEQFAAEKEEREAIKKTVSSMESK